MRKTGRPPQYTEAQVLEGIRIVEKQGETPTGDTVKKAMCAQLLVPGGINAQSLEREVQRLLEERKRQRRDHLVAALPVMARDAVKEIGALVEAAILNHMAEQHDALRSLTGRKMAEMKIDLGNQREQIRALLARIDDKDSEIADLETERHGLSQRLEMAAAEISFLKERVSELEREGDLRTRVLALMKETLGQNARASAQSAYIAK